MGLRDAVTHHGTRLVLSAGLRAALRLGTTAILAPVCFFAVMALAGPHGSILPESLHRLVFLVAWGLLLTLPIGVARTVHHRWLDRE